MGLKSLQQNQGCASSPKTLWPSIASLWFCAALVALGSCGSTAAFQSESLALYSQGGLNSGLENWTYVDGAEGLELLRAHEDPSLALGRLLSAPMYVPNTGDSGVDEFLMGCYKLGSQPYYRYQEHPQVLLTLATAVDALGEYDPATVRAIVEDITGPPGAQYAFPKVADIFKWNSYGQFYPQFTLLAPNEGWYYVDPTDYYAGDSGYSSWPGEGDFLDLLYTKHQLWQFRFSDALPTMCFFCDTPPGVGGLALVYPGASHEFAGDTLYCSQVEVAYEDLLIDSPANWDRHLAHELVHALGNARDLYQALWYEPQGNPVISANMMVGIMGQKSWGTDSDRYIVGFQKALFGWVPLVRLKYDCRSLAVQEAGIPAGRRDFYYLGPYGSAGREFFLIENMGVSPNECYGISGLLVTHFFLEREYASPQEYKADRCAPWFAWMNAVGAEPWQQSGREWNFQWMEYPGELYNWLYPYGSDEFLEDGIPNSRLWSGERSGIELRNIVAHDNLVSAAVPASYGQAYEIIERRRDGDDEFNFGVITMDAYVGRPLPGDLNADGIVNNGDYLMLRANLGRRIGEDEWAIPLDVNGDGRLQLTPDRDGDGYIATSERIYNDRWELVHDSGDWLDVNCDGRNDLDPAGSGEYEIAGFDANADGIVDQFDPDGDGFAELVPSWLDANGDGTIDEQDNCIIGYHWQETTFEEIWISLPPLSPN